MREKKRIVREGYDRIAEAYTKARQAMKSSDGKYLKLLVERLPPRSAILDIGCGSGVPITRFLASRGHRVTGVDISTRQIERARVLVPEATFLEGDIMHTSFPDGVFDAVVSFYTVIHIPREEYRALLARVHKMLKRRGLLLVTLGSDDWVSTEEYEPFGVRMYWSHFGPEAYRRMLSKAGLHILVSSTEREEFQGEYEETFYVLGEKALASGGPLGCGEFRTC